VIESGGNRTASGSMGAISMRNALGQRGSIQRSTQRSPSGGGRLSR
jgi:hypothetical protein